MATHSSRPSSTFRKTWGRNPERLLLCKIPQLLWHPAHRRLPANLLRKVAQQTAWKKVTEQTNFSVRFTDATTHGCVLTHMHTTCACSSTDVSDPRLSKPCHPSLASHSTPDNVFNRLHTTYCWLFVLLFGTYVSWDMQVTWWERPWSSVMWHRARYHCRLLFKLSLDGRRKVKERKKLDDPLWAYIILHTAHAPYTDCIWLLFKYGSTLSHITEQTWLLSCSTSLMMQHVNDVYPQSQKS